MTWVGSGEKEGESFHVCFSAAQCWRGTVAEQGSAWSASTNYIPTKQTRCLLYKLHTYHTNKMSAIQTTYLPYKLDACHTNYIPTMQTRCLPYKLHTYHTNWVLAIQTTYQLTIQTRCLPYKLHTYHTN